MKPYTRMLEEIKVLHEKFVNIPHYYGLLRRIEDENNNLRVRVNVLENKVNQLMGIETMDLNERELFDSLICLFVKVHKYSESEKSKLPFMEQLKKLYKDNLLILENDIMVKKITSKGTEQE